MSDEYANDVAQWVRSGFPHPPTPGFGYAKQAAELIEILRADFTRDERRKRIRAIGTLIAEIGGFGAMQEVAAEVRWQFPRGEGGEDGWHPGLIDAYWEGIAGWRW